MATLKKKIGNKVRGIVDKANYAFFEGNAPLGTNGLQVLREWGEKFLIPAKDNAKNYCEKVENLGFIKFTDLTPMMRVSRAMTPLVERINELNKNDTLKHVKYVFLEFKSTLRYVNALAKMLSVVTVNRFDGIPQTLDKIMTVPAHNIRQAVQKYFNPFIDKFKECFGKKKGDNITDQDIMKFNKWYRNFQKNDTLLRSNGCLLSFDELTYFKFEPGNLDRENIEILRADKRRCKEFVVNVNIFTDWYIKNIPKLKGKLLKQLQELFTKLDKLKK